MKSPYSFIQESTPIIPIDNSTNNAERVSSNFTFSEKFLTVWAEWKMHYRAKTKKEMAPNTEKKSLELVANYNEDFLIGLIKKAIANDWKNFYFENIELQQQKYLNTKSKTHGTIKSKTGESFDSHVVDAFRKYS